MTISRSDLPVPPEPEQFGVTIARVLRRLERVQRGLGNSVVAVRSTNVTLPRAILQHHHAEVTEACNELRTAMAGPVARAVPDRVKYGVLLDAWDDDAPGYRCARCGAYEADRKNMHVDHKIPLARGGSNDRSNLEALCRTCNLGKGASAA